MPVLNPGWTDVANLIGIATIIIVWILASAWKRRRALETVQSAIDRGQQLDAATVRLLLGGETQAEVKSDLLIHACIWSALGAGFVLWSIVGFDEAHGVFLGLGGLLLCLGGGLFAASRLAYRKDSGADAAE